MTNRLSAAVQWVIPQHHIIPNGPMRVFSDGWSSNPATRPQISLYVGGLLNRASSLFLRNVAKFKHLIK